MLAVEVSKFEPDDLGDAMRAARSRQLVRRVVALAIVALALITAGTTVLTVRRGIAALPALACAALAWMFVTSLIGALRRPPPPVDPEALRQYAALVLPMRIAFEDRRLRVEMPIGWSAFAYDRVASWQQTTRTFRITCREEDGREGGTFIVPRSCVSPPTVAAIESFLVERGVRIAQTS